MIGRYWPSLRTLLPIVRPQLDNAVAGIDSYTFISRPTRATRATDAAVRPSESVGTTDEMKPAVCYKQSDPMKSRKAQSVARPLIRRDAEDPPYAPMRPPFAGQQRAVSPRTATCGPFAPVAPRPRQSAAHCFFE